MQGDVQLMKMDDQTLLQPDKDYMPQDEANDGDSGKKYEEEGMLLQMVLKEDVSQDEGEEVQLILLQEKMLQNLQRSVQSEVTVYLGLT